MKKNIHNIVRKTVKQGGFLMNKKDESVDRQKKGRIQKQGEMEVGNFCEVGEDSTKYGEFVSSYFAWLSLPKQKEKAEDLEKMTDSKKQNK